MREQTVSAVGTSAVDTDRMHVSMSIHKSAYAHGYAITGADSAEPLVASLTRAARSLKSRVAASNPSTASIHISATSSLDSDKLKESLDTLQANELV